MTAPVVRWRFEVTEPEATHWVEVDIDGRTTRLTEADAASLETQLAQTRAMIARYEAEQAAGQTVARASLIRDHETAE